MVYDSNFPNTSRSITLTQDSSGRWNGWYYNLNDVYDWGSAYSGCSISYVPYEHFYRIWNNRGTVASNMELLTVNMDANIYDVDGNLVVSITDGEIVTERDNVYPLEQFGITEDGQFPPTGNSAVWLPADLYTVRRGGAALMDGKTAEFQAAMTHMDQSASIVTSASSVTFAVDDASEMNYVALDEEEQGEQYDITLTSTLKESYNEVRLTGSVLEKAMTFAQISGSLFVDGSNISTGGALYINGELMETSVHEEAAPAVVTFSPGAGSGSMAPETVGEGGAYRLPLCGFEAPTGAQFGGWMVDGTAYQPGATIYLSGNVIAYAQWTAGNQTPDNEVPCSIRDITVSETGVTVWIENRNAEDACVWAAAYTQEGRLLRVASQSLTVVPSQSGSISIPLSMDSAASVRVFVVDRDFRPMCAGMRKDIS